MTAVLDFTKPHVLRTEEEYSEAIRMLDELLDSDPLAGTEEHDLLEFLSVLVEAYEAEHYPDEMFSTTPQDVVDFVLGQKGMQRGDLAEIMGGKSRVSEFFAGKRELSRTQIRALRDLLGIPADLLL
ncbi:MAG TPA: helix-turn-helix domain-containing protein [Longimicrobium sp.]|uniref:helix-turn-helix domain-containing protein n=1 Tax=Longimicrobium sp. TaxID=2029185 RepID=UPI002ED9F871